MTDVSYPLAFLAGFLSFLSPCILPLIPSYVSYMTGASFEDMRTGDRGKIRKLTIINSLAFIFGFSFIFISLGASSSAIGGLFLQYQDALRIGGGVLIILFGLYIMGVLNIKFLSQERKLHLRGKPSGYLGSFFIGMTFAAGWTPCIGPILGSILLYASTTGSISYGFNLLLVYSIGLGLPFFITAIAINAFLSRLTAIQRYMRAIIILSGLLLIAFGLLLLTDSLRVIVGLIPDFGFRF